MDSLLRTNGIADLALLEAVGPPTIDALSTLDNVSRAGTRQASLTTAAGHLVAWVAVLFLVRSILTLHPVDGYGAAILFVLGLGLIHDHATDHIDLGEQRVDA